MNHWEALCMNPLTGRKVWAVRHIPDGEYGDPFKWSMVVIRPWLLSKKAVIMLIQGMDLRKRREIQRTLLEHGFERADALERGRWHTWVNGRRVVNGN